MEAVPDTLLRDNVLVFRLVAIIVTVYFLTLGTFVAYARRGDRANSGVVSWKSLATALVGVTFWMVQHVILQLGLWRISTAWFNAVTLTGGLAVGMVCGVLVAIAKPKRARETDALNENTLGPDVVVGPARRPN